MNWKEKLADWLTGGAYNHKREENMRLHSHVKTAEDALHDIISMRTPSANATVKRMAARAEEVVGK